MLGYCWFNKCKVGSRDTSPPRCPRRHSPLPSSPVCMPPPFVLPSCPGPVMAIHVNETAPIRSLKCIRYTIVEVQQDLDTACT